jgi:hypothetical protein
MQTIRRESREPTCVAVPLCAATKNRIFVLTDVRKRTCNIFTPIKTVAATTSTLPKKRTKSPTELIAVTRRTFDTRSLNAWRPA